ncbi:MAG: 16S rRNA (uracil(1498)-N(3))-methyltransferase [Candidatus Riflebacteria bacterium]|nr:16S rRNA (uracil(1498)-N(3))-methyltransferase [Candidatus Riflebacteria bacterium]
MLTSVAHKRVYQPGNSETLSKDNSHYLTRVMRLKPGDHFQIVDGEGEEVDAILGESGAIEIRSRKRPDREISYEIRLFPALTKGDRIENLIEKAVELGALRISPLITERCVVGIPSANKIERWRKIAISAMLQCGGCVLPVIDEPIKTSEIPVPYENTISVILHEVPLAVSLNKLPEIKHRLYIASGPEGGFSDKEVEDFQGKGWQPVWLGKRLFKADTAPICALSAILMK